MKVLSLSFFLALWCGADARLGSPADNTTAFPDFIVGNWTQVLSSRYVQQTAEIDWDCVRVRASRTPSGVLAIEKTGIMHNTPDLVAIVVREFRPEFVEDRWVFHPVNIQSLRRVDMRVDYHNDTGIVILSSDDRLSVYVWTRAWDVYTGNSKNISKILHELDFATYYRFPVPSFTGACVV
jgi:hypothetical protein